jgi:hypothetical protein
LVELFLVHTSNQAVQYSITHRYKLQPQKSVVIEVNKKGRNQQDKNLPLKINQDDMPTVEKSARKPTLTLISFDIELTGHKLFFYCVIMLSTYVVK